MGWFWGSDNDHPAESHSASSSREVDITLMPKSNETAHEPPPQSQRDPVDDGPVTILVLGRSGSGKTLFVKTATAEQGRVVDGTSIERTTDVASSNIVIDDVKFKIIDTPGFHNLTMSNLEAHTKLANYLLDKKRIKSRIAGIVYIHRSDDPPDGKTLVQNIGVISDVFLGDSGLSRLTIMVVSGEPGTHKPASARKLSRTGVFGAAHAKGAEIVDATFYQGCIDDIILHHASQSPVLLRIQEEGIKNPRIPIGAQIKERLGYPEPEPTVLNGRDQQHPEPHTGGPSSPKPELEPSVLDVPHAYEETRQALKRSQEEILALAQQLQLAHSEHTSLLSQIQDQAKELRSAEAVLKKKDARVLELTNAHKRIEQLRESDGKERRELRERLQQAENNYTSLRSQFQLQENIEKRDIVQTLKDLNRDIDDLGRSISAYLVDSYVQKTPGGVESNMTALDACHLPELKELLGHADGVSSLVASSNGVGMPVEDFLDYAIRALLCKHLGESIFNPFHPAANSSQNRVVATMYDNIQRQESQTVAAKWRASCFKSICEPEDQATVARHVERVVQGFINDGLSPLLTYFFGEQAGVRLETQHKNPLMRLFQTAWDWNSTLKGEVILLGDFHTTYYSPLHRFDPERMSEFEPDARGSRSRRILGTLGLGLVSSRAVGGGQEPEETLVLKAVVAMKGLYT
ncbi:hypothetical protein FRC08_012873 [Ceratobasidium sp. 394]|nr:hypothetical protein FRC08_012873 [Ceratobasidium sp. 394]